MPRMIALFSTLMLASACSVSPSGAGVGTVSSASRPATPAFRAPTAMGTAGLEGIIGERAGSLVRRFGEARIDLAEGDARKLQFTSDRCVLDVFLYPSKRMASLSPPTSLRASARAGARRIGSDALARLSDRPGGGNPVLSTFVPWKVRIQGTHGLMTTHFTELAQRAAADGQVTSQEVLALRRQGWGDGIIVREEAEALFALNNALDVRDEEWCDFFVEAIGEFVLNGTPAPAMRRRRSRMADRAGRSRRQA